MDAGLLTLAEVSLNQGLILLAVGLGAGLLGGLLGIGGGIVMIPAMVILLGEGQKAFGENSIHVYKLAAITTSLVLSVPAIVRHARARAIVVPMLPALVPLAVVGVVAGVLLAGTFVGDQAHRLRQVFGVFLEAVVVFNLYQTWQQRHGGLVGRLSCPLPRQRLRIGGTVGLPAGLIAGLLGVGGGVWAVPVQRLALGLQVRNAIANSSTLIAFIAPATAVALTLQLAALDDPQAPPHAGWLLAIWLAPGALLGGWCGASLTHRLPVGVLRDAFQLLLAVTGLRLIWQ